MKDILKIQITLKTQREWNFRTIETLETTLSKDLRVYLHLKSVLLDLVEVKAVGGVYFLAVKKNEQNSTYMYSSLVLRR